MVGVSFLFQPSYVAFALWCQYILPIALLVLSVLSVQDSIELHSDEHSRNYNKKIMDISHPEILMYCMVAIYSALVFIPLFAFCKKFKSACKENNLKDRFKFPQLTFPKGLAPILMSGKCNKRD